MFLLSCVGIHSLPPSLTSMRLSHLQHIKALSCVSSSPNHPSLFHSSHFHSNHSTRFAWSLNDINEGMSYNKFGIHLYIAIRFFYLLFNSQDDRRDSLSPAVRRASLPGPSRRLSKSSSERTSTPPRKILPKQTEEAERTSSESPVAATGGGAGPRTNHLPVGVIG